MDNIQQAQNDFTEVLRAQLEKASIVKPKPRCALRISFYHDTHIDFVAKAFAPVTGELHRVNNILIKICDNHDAAMSLCRELNSLVHSFNDKALNRPLYPEWLDDYYAVQSWGINVIGAEQAVRTIEDEVKRQNDKSKVEDDPKQYMPRRTFAKDNIMGYSLEALKADVTAFLLAGVTIPKGNEERAAGCIEAMFCDLMLTVKGKLALENYANQRLVHAICSKSTCIMDSSGMGELEHLDAYRRSEAKKNSAERFLAEHKLGFTDVRTGLGNHLSELLEMVELSEAPATFAGLDLMYSSAYELSDFSKSGLESMAESRYCSVGSAAAFILIDLFLEYFRILTNARHKAALMELSRTLSVDNLYSDAIEGIYREMVF